MIGPDVGRPVMFTYHAVPDGRPDSVNVTVYVTGRNVMATGEVGPLTVSDPVYAFGA